MVQNKSISLCMVVWNSVDITERAILSVKSIIDEIVIIDQGSDEDQSEKLKSLADIYFKVTNKGNGDFDRQYCYSLATKDFILAMDSDEFIDESNLAKLQQAMKFNFDIMWFMFDNKVTYDGKEIDIKDVLGDDPHPRLWKRLIGINGQPTPPIIWPQEAHTFPKMLSQRVVFCDMRFSHIRTLENIIKTHLKRGKNISPNAQGMEKEFVRTLLNKFGFTEKRQITEKFSELVEYLR